MKGFIPGDPRAIAAGTKGGAKSGELRRKDRIAWWQQQYPGVDVEALEAARSMGYQAGWRKGVTQALKSRRAE